MRDERNRCPKCGKTENQIRKGYTAEKVRCIYASNATGIHKESGKEDMIAEHISIKKYMNPFNKK